MGTKNKSAGSQHTPRGVTQGVSLVAPNGLPIDYVVDGTGKIRLAVDANVIINNATVNVDIDSTTDNIAIRNTSNSNELLINGDGSINTNVAVSASDGDNIAIHDSDGDELEINADGSVNAVVTATDLDIRDLTHVSDSIKIGDGSNFLAVNGDGSVNVGNTVTVQATDFDIRDLTHISDSIKIGDGSDFLLVNPDGSINVVTTGTVTVDQGTTPWITAIDQTGSNNDVDVLTLPNVVLASQASPFTTDVNISLNGEQVDISDRAARLLGIIYGSQGQQLKQTATNFNTAVELFTDGTAYDARQIRALTSETDSIAATQSGTWTVQQGTPPWSVVGNVASSTTDSGNPVKIGGVYRTLLPTLTNGQRGDIQLDVNSKEIVKSELRDSQTFDNSNITLRSELRVAESIRLVGAEQVGTTLDINMWETTLTGSGIVTAGSGLNQLSTGVTSNSSSFLASRNRARFINGSMNAFFAGIRLGDTGVANNVRRWGAYDATNGVFFQLNGTTVGIGIRQNSVDTIVTSFNGTNSFTLDTNFHTYEIQFNPGSAYFYQDKKLIHTYISTTTALTDTPHHKLGFESTNSGGGTSNALIYVRGSSILRYGNANSKPRYFHPFFVSRVQFASGSTNGAQASVTVNLPAPTTAGNLLVVTAIAQAGTATVSDSASQSYSTAVTQVSGAFNGYQFYKANTAGGVTSVTLTRSVGTDRMSLIVTEYANILTSSPLDQTASQAQTAVTSWTSTATAATTQAVELLVGSAIVITKNNAVFTAGTDFNAVTTQNGVGGGHTSTVFSEDRYVVTTGTYEATGTIASSETVISMIGTYKLNISGLSTGFTVPNTPTLIAIGVGVLKKVIINNPGTSGASATFYDNTTNFGNPIAVVSLTSGQNELEYELNFNTGLTMVLNSTSGDITVIYE